MITPGISKSILPGRRIGTRSARIRGSVRTAACTRGSIAILLTMAFLATCAGCVSQKHRAYWPEPSAGPESVRAAFTAPAEPPDFELAPGDPCNGHEALNIYRPRPCGALPEPGPEATAYVSRAPGQKRWIIVLPIWGSSTYPPRKVVRWLLESTEGRGTNVLWIHGKAGLMRYQVWKDAPTEEEFRAAVARSGQCLSATVEDVRGFIDWIVARPDADPKRIGIVGFSIGAMISSLVMGHDPRVSAGVLVMVGGHPSQILATCSGSELEVRQKVMARFGWDLERYTREIEAQLGPVDPVSFAGNINPASVLYIDAGKDACMPPSSREDLWRAMGEPERITVGYGHRWSFLTMTILGMDVTTRHIVSFLENKLAPPDRSDKSERASQGGGSSSAGAAGAAQNSN